jgi:hypothetical protein
MTSFYKPCRGGFQFLWKSDGDEVVLSHSGIKTRCISQTQFTKYTILVATRKPLKCNKLSLYTLHITFNLC